MTKTHTPLIIEGKIYVVVDAPVRDHLVKRVYYSRLAACTKYETLPEHAPYWEERIGQRVEVEIVGCCNSHCTGLCITINSTTYAIPPQQKQGDEYSWDMAWHKYKRETPNEQRSFKSLLDYLENNFNLTKK